MEIKYRPYCKLSNVELFEKYHKESRVPTILEMTVGTLCYSLSWTFHRLTFWILIILLIMFMLCLMFKKENTKLGQLKREIKLRNLIDKARR